MPVQQFRLPDLGEGLTEGDILRWTVQVGDVVEVNDTIAEVETVKAAVELPSPFAGTVTALHAQEGETVPVGTPIISIDTGNPSDPSDPSAPPAPSDTPAADEQAEDPAQDLVPSVPAEEEKQLTLVGYGPREQTGGRRRRRSAPSADPVAQAAGAPAQSGAQVSFNLPPATSEPEPEQTPAGLASVRVLAKPPVRKLAKDLGVDLRAVAATGPNGTVSREDVRAAADEWSPTGTSGQHQVTTAAVSDHSPRETRIPVRGVRKHTAAARVSSAFTAPHVTEFVTCDVTATMDLRERVAARREFRDVKVSPLLFLARAVLLAARRTPEINSAWDEPRAEIVLKHYVNLGIAAATERGLIVPNIKDADRLSLRELAGALTDLTDTARAGRTTPADLTGGTLTITNVGVFGVDTGTPILNPGEAGIVAFGSVARRPWVVGTGPDERLEPRWVTTLAVSFDHRLVDGQQGSQFLADVAQVLGDPGLAML